MIFPSALLAVSAVVGVAQAQESITPGSVALSVRQGWCQDQTAVCPEICFQLSPGDTKKNTCDPKALTFQCTCGNGISPNITEYTQTLPYHICTEWGNQCVTACGHDNSCSAACRDDHPCGAQSPKRVNATGSPTAAPTSSSTDSSDTIFTGVPGSTGTPSKKGAAPSLEIGRTYGLFIVLGSMFVGFAML